MIAADSAPTAAAGNATIATTTTSVATLYRRVGTSPSVSSLTTETGRNAAFAGAFVPTVTAATSSSDSNKRHQPPFSPFLINCVESLVACRPTQDVAAASSRR